MQKVGNTAWMKCIVRAGKGCNLRSKAATTSISSKYTRRDSNEARQSKAIAKSLAEERHRAP